jgi:hypothetical protein
VQDPDYRRGVDRWGSRPHASSAADQDAPLSSTVDEHGTA